LKSFKRGEGIVIKRKRNTEKRPSLKKLADWKSARCHEGLKVVRRRLGGRRMDRSVWEQKTRRAPN